VRQDGAQNRSMSQRERMLYMHRRRTETTKQEAGGVLTPQKEP